MPITIGSNIASIRAQRELSKGSDAVAKVFERLASGMRINHASDDAAGLSVSEQLKANSRVFTQGVRNLNDGISVLAIADGAVGELSNIIIRIRELATESANKTYSSSQRNALDIEAQALSQEYSRIARSTEFNGMHLFDGSVDTLRLQSGYGENGGIRSSLGGVLGDGTFSGGTATSTGGAAISFGDLNGDGILDLVTAGASGGVGRAYVQLGIGNGTFSSATSYTTEGTASQALALADVNGDGSLDLITAGYGGAGGSATVRLGTGNGTFGAFASYATETTESNAVTLGDINGDGNLDLVTAGSSTGVGWSTIRLGTGSGSFGTALSYFTGESYESNAVSLGDVNGDGKLDLVTAGRDSSSGTATIRLGAGNGTFGATATYTTEATASTALTLRDLNGDGKLDLVTAGYATGLGGWATVRLGASNGTFGASTSYATESQQSNAVALEDLNGDGSLDLVSGGTLTTLGGRVNVRIGNASGTFGAAVSYVVGPGAATGVALGDLNRDGVLDIMAAEGSLSSTPLIGNTRGGIAPLLTFSLKSVSDARWTMSLMEQKLGHLATQRGTIGAFQSRVESAARVIESMIENYKAAAGRISDTDIADDSSELLRRKILQESGIAVLGQANQQPALALQLLRN